MKPKASVRIIGIGANTYVNRVGSNVESFTERNLRKSMDERKEFSTLNRRRIPPKSLFNYTKI